MVGFVGHVVKQVLNANYPKLWLVIDIPSKEEEEKQLIQAMNALEEFSKILVKNYPLVFKDGSGSLTCCPQRQHRFFPYKVDLKITKMETE